MADFLGGITHCRAVYLTLEILELLAKAGPNSINEPDNNGWTVLLSLAIGKSDNLVYVLSPEGI